MTKRNSPKGKAQLPRGSGAKKASPANKTNQATTEDMQREGLGVAAKE